MTGNNWPEDFSFYTDDYEEVIPNDLLVTVKHDIYLEIALILHEGGIMDWLGKPSPFPSWREEPWSVFSRLLTDREILEKEYNS